MLLFGNHTKCFVHVLKASAASFAKKIDLTPKKKTSKGNFNDKTRTNVGLKGNIDFTLKDSEDEI